MIASFILRLLSVTPRLAIGAALPLVWACATVAPSTTELARATAVAGFYEGTLQSREHGEVPISLNVLEENSSLVGTLFTPLGDFPIAQDSLTGARVHLRFTVGDGEIGLIGGEWGSDEIRGTWQLGEDGGPLKIRRVGTARARVPVSEPSIDLSSEQWREDLRYLAAELPRLHGDAFHTVSRETFEDSVRALDGRLPMLQGHEAAASIGRIVAMVGDGHTYLEMPATFRRYPLRLYAFGDTLRITHVGTGNEHLLGGRVVAIGSTPVSDAMRLVGRQIARENAQYVLKELPYFLTQAELLHAHRVVPEPTHADWTVETIDGARTSVRLTPVAPGQGAPLVSAAEAVPRYRQRPGEDLWYEYLPASQTLYVGFRGYPARPAFREFFNEVFRVADENAVERLMIDLRENSGGDFNKVRELLLPRLKEHALNRRGSLYVFIGRHTFSAAMTNAADFLNETNATLVGEPTGARPNGWQEKGQFVLPQSRLAVSVSLKYYRFVNDDSATAVFPHQHVPLTWEDYRAGRDPVFEWSLAQPRVR